MLTTRSTAARSGMHLLRDAFIDETNCYRYWLSRCWNESLPKIAWVMLNPSKATAIEDDATLRKCMGFSTRWGYGGLYLVNLFAYIATSPDTLQKITQAEAIGDQNDQHILETIQKAAVVLIAWGNMGNLFQRDQAVLKLLEGTPLYCLGTTNSHQPRHPVRLGYKTKCVCFEPAAIPLTASGKEGTISVSPAIGEFTEFYML